MTRSEIKLEKIKKMLEVESVAVSYDIHHAITTAHILPTKALLVIDSIDDLLEHEISLESVFLVIGVASGEEHFFYADMHFKTKFFMELLFSVEQSGITDQDALEELAYAKAIKKYDDLMLATAFKRKIFQDAFTMDPILLDDLVAEFVAVHQGVIQEAIDIDELYREKDCILNPPKKIRKIVSKPKNEIKFPKA